MWHFRIPIADTIVVVVFVFVLGILYAFHVKFDEKVATFRESMNSLDATAQDRLGRYEPK